MPPPVAPAGGHGPSAAASLPVLTPIEIASGVVFGAAPPEDGRTGAGATPRIALEDVLDPALERTPCFVAFSGGRDSSAMLAAATARARARGLPDPVPLTMRFAAHARTQESDWQERLIRHLGLEEWVRLELSDELDALGPAAAGELRRLGLYWPPNAHSMVLLGRAAAGGALVTGNGGDEILSPWSGRWFADVRAGRVRPRPGELEHVVLGLSPEPLRRLAWRVRRPLRLPWLTRSGSAQLAAVVAERWAQSPRSWGAQIEDMLATRSLWLAGRAFRAFMAPHDVLLVEPFLDPRFARAVARAFPPEGPASRSGALTALFGDLVPAEFCRRSTKAAFTEVLWGPATRRFAERWDGSGVDRELVDPDRLRAAWLAERPDVRSLSAMHAAWLRGAAQAVPAASRSASTARPAASHA